MRFSESLQCKCQHHHKHHFDPSFKLHRAFIILITRVQQGAIAGYLDPRSKFQLHCSTINLARQRLHHRLFHSSSQSLGLTCMISHPSFLEFFVPPILDLHKSSCITKYSFTAIFDSIVSSRNFRNIIQVYKSSSVVDLTRLGVASNVYASMSDHYTNEYIFTQAKFPPSSSLPFAFSMSDLLVDIVPCKIFSISHFGNSSVTLEAICFR